MAEDIAETLRSKIGVEWEPVVYEIAKGMIRRFVQAVGDPNPLWQDEAYAAQSSHGSIIAPPIFILAIGFEQIRQKLAPMISGTTVHGSTELECYYPIKPGDVDISASSE